MSKAIEGAAMIGAAIAVEASALAMAGGSLGAATVGLPFLTHLAITLGAGGVAMEAGAIASALTSNRGMNITTRQPASARQIIYGMQRVGGVSVYQSTTGKNHDQYNYVIAVAGHKCWGFEALYLDGRKVFFEGSGSGYAVHNGIGFGGNPTSGTHVGPDGVDYNFGSLIFAEAYYGDQTAADLCESLTANDINWITVLGKGTPYLGGCSWFYFKCNYSANTFPGAPEIRLTVYGKPVYDPRTGETVYSANSALVAADWLQDTEFGLGIPVNQTQLIAAANVCDEHIALAAGGTESQFQCHYHFDTSTSPSDVLATMLKSMGGRVSIINGEAYIWPAYWQGPSANLDESALTAPVQWDSTAAYKDNCNRVTGTYTAPNFPYNIAGDLYDSNGWDAEGNIQNNFQFGFQPTNFPQYACDPLHGYAADQWLNEDSGATTQYDPAVSYPAGAIVGYASDRVFTSPAESIATNEHGTVTVAAGSMSFPGYQVFTSLVAGNLGNTPAVGSSKWQLNAAVELPLEVNYNMVLSIAQAQRLAKIELLRRRFWGRGTLEVGLMAFTMQECDVMDFTFPLHGWTEKPLEIISTTVKVIAQEGSPGQPGKPPEIRIVFDVAETDPSIYEWSDVEELSIYDIGAPAPQQYGTPAPPTNLAVISSAATALVNPDGSVAPRLEVTWDTPLDGLVNDIEIQYLLVGGSAGWIDCGNVNVGLNFAYISGIAAGNSYSVQIRSSRPSGAVSDWVGPVTITAGLVLSIQTQTGVGIGSLVGMAFTDGTAGIKCNPFTAYIGQLSLPIFPSGAVTLTGLAQQTLYYLYYIDPGTAGGDVTPIATKVQSDFLGKLGYWLIDSIVTPYAGTTGSAMRYSPLSYSDTGTETTTRPAYAMDGNTATEAVVSGTYSTDGTTESGTTGQCTWAGFSPGSLGYVAHLNIGARFSDTSDNAITYTLTVTIGTTVTTLVSGNSTVAATNYQLSIPSGTDLATISVQATVQGIESVDGGGSSPLLQVAAIFISEIYIQ